MKAFIVVSILAFLSLYLIEREISRDDRPAFSEEFAAPKPLQQSATENRPVVKKISIAVESIQPSRRASQFSKSREIKRPQSRRPVKGFYAQRHQGQVRLK